MRDIIEEITLESRKIVFQFRVKRIYSDLYFFFDVKMVGWFSISRGEMTLIDVALVEVDCDASLRVDVYFLKRIVDFGVTD